MASLIYTILYGAILGGYFYSMTIESIWVYLLSASVGTVVFLVEMYVLTKISDKLSTPMLPSYRIYFIKYLLIGFCLSPIIITKGFVDNLFNTIQYWESY